MEKSTEADQHNSLEALPPIEHQDSSFQYSLYEPIRLQGDESIGSQSAASEAVIRNKTSFFDPCCSNFGSTDNSSRQGHQEISDAAFTSDEGELLQRSAQNSKRHQNCQLAQNPLEEFEPYSARTTNAEAEEPFSSSAIKYVLSYLDFQGTRFKDEVVQNIQSLEPKFRNQQEKGESILEVTRIVRIQDMQVDHTKPLLEQNVMIRDYGPCEIKINSIAIINALYSVVSYWPGLNLNTPSLIIQEPFTILYLHRELLQKYADSKSSSPIQKVEKGCQREQNIDTHLRLLFDFLTVRPEAKKIDMERDRHNRSTPAATFEMLWMLFSPGTDVFVDNFGDGCFSARVVKQVFGGGLTMDSVKPLVIKFWYLDFDGDFIGRKQSFVSIPPFPGEKEIGTLPVIPCDFYKRVSAGQVSDESRLLRQKFVGYGEKFLELTQRRCVQYSGETYTFPRRSYHGRVIVDMEAFWFEEATEKLDLDGSDDDEIIPVPQCSCKYCIMNKQIPLERRSRFGGYDQLRPGADNVSRFTDHHKFLLTQRIFGYILSIRSWEEVSIANVTECQWNRSMIDNQLSIPDGDRNMIKGLVQRYFRGESLENSGKGQWNIDFIKEKGDNQIFLLHGKPGVGKTFTAECVAEFVQRPLLSLSCTDVGVDAHRVETNLLNFFKKAKLWGAVLLLDEADVYLEQRTSRDLERNCLVAAFLRCLEYCKGVLFLTTNRVGAFDDALVSRVSIVLHYEFDEQRRQDVWDTFFHKLERERGRQIKVPYSTREYARHDSELSRLKWNGREIRNAFQIAVALAEYTDERDPADGLITLRHVHFQQVVRMSANFARYMHKVQGAEAEKIAANRGDRNEYSKQRDAKTNF